MKSSTRASGGFSPLASDAHYTFVGGHGTQVTCTSLAEGEPPKVRRSGRTKVARLRVTCLSEYFYCREGVYMLSEGFVPSLLRSYIRG